MVPKGAQKFQLALKDISVSLMQQDLWQEGKLVPFFADLGIKAFKLVHMPDKTRKMIVYFDNYESTREIQNAPITWQGNNLQFMDRATPALGFKSTHRSPKKGAKTPSNNTTSARSGRQTSTRKPPDNPKETNVIRLHPRRRSTSP